MWKYFRKIVCENCESFRKKLYLNIVNEEKKFIVTANPETLMLAIGNPEFDRILLSNECTIVPDGIGIVKAAKLLKLKVNERITGVELSSWLFEIANKEKKSIYLFGAKPDVVRKLIEKISIRYPDIIIAGYEHGYVKDKDKVMDQIVQMQPDITLLALGIPQQELLISRYYNRFKKGIFIGVGGSFDVLSGTKKRAPEIFIKLNLEWLYRIASEPKRLKRFFVSNVRFIFLIYKTKREKKNEC